jgi:hypothetical protein
MKHSRFPAVVNSVGIASLLILSLAPPLAGQASSDASKLLGKWVGRTDIGQAVLEFRSATQLLFEGEAASYRLLPGIIRVQDEEGTADYRYTFRGTVLVVSFPEGFQIEFTRVGPPPAGSGGESEKPAAAPPVAPVSELMAQFAGTWATMTKNTETRVTLTAQGEFYSGYESSYSGRFDGGGGWGQANASSERGRWAVRGDRRQGLITLTYQNGNQTQVSYRVHVENGETYWSEYWFNGDLYGKQRR